jgi:hypothetical protein
LQAALLAACKTRLGYDLQCEASRERYLHRLISLTGRSKYYFDKLLLALLACDS